MSSNRAFTLLELLVVITIIGILSSIVIVSMSGSTDSATIAKGKAYAQQVHALLGANAVGVWNFDEGITDTCPGTEDVCDISGYGNHGTFSGDTYFVDSDIEGYALSFDGTGDYVNCGSDISLSMDSSNEVSLSAWFYVSELDGTYRPIIDASYGSPRQAYYLSIGANSKLLGAVWEDGVQKHIYGNTVLTAVHFNTWVYVVFVADGHYTRIYLNGVQDGITDWTSYEIGANNVDLLIGKYVSSFFNGLIDEVRIYTEALPSTEIQKHYVQGLERLLTNQAVTKAEYDQRMKEFNQSLVLYEE